MNVRESILDTLPAPWAIAADSLTGQLIDGLALELDAAQEDIERLRRTHWVEHAYQLADLDGLAALVGVRRLPWEAQDLFRARLLPTVRARLAGALGPLDVQRFIADYLHRAEEALDRGERRALLVPGLRGRRDESAFAVDPRRPLRQPLVLLENPPQNRVSRNLQARGGRIPYLFRWQENNGGLDPAWPRFTLDGFAERRTTVPMLVNLSAGAFIGYRGTVPLGRRLTIGAVPDSADGLAVADLDGQDVSDRLFSCRRFVAGRPFDDGDLDRPARLPPLARGDNRWLYLSVGFYDLRGLDRFFFALTDEALREGAFDDSTFDNALFPAGDVVRLAMSWIESEPASFEVRVPRGLVVEPAEEVAASIDPPHRHVAQAAELAIDGLRAAGVRARLRFEPFRERQRQAVRARLPWQRLDPETASAGRADRLSLGARYGDSPLGETRFE
ncbi:MAG TPA: hypothetical protein PJ981_11460 [Accumulibacter sp.]|nr:hypothetical protein [Accumulibacter sp.]HNL13862.1 hypothetical protein [Accumulibacter sp.]